MRFNPILLAIAALFHSSLLLADPPVVELNTSEGLLVLELEPELAPTTVANFLDYVEDGFYNGTIFHRVIDGFMIQGGGFTADYQRKQTRKPIVNEANNGLRNQRYTIAMARTNAPHSATAQFFINSEDNNNLDHTGTTARGWGYTVFGRVIDGHDVVDQIGQSPTGPGGPFSRDAPRSKIVIESAVWLKPEIEETDETAPTEPTVADPVDVTPAAKALEQSGALAIQ